MATINLSKDLIKKTKDSIWEELGKSDKKYVADYYAKLVSTCVSHPAAIVRGRVVKGTVHIQRLLNIFILWQRLFYPIIVLIIVLGLVKSLWILLAVPVVLVFHFYFSNNIQTRLCVEIAARLVVLDDLMEQDEKFREHILHLYKINMK